MEESISYLAWMEGLLYPTVTKTGTLEKAEVSVDTEVFDKVGAPGRDRTCDNQLRRLVLYPTELRARGESRTITDQPNYPVGLYTITRPPGRASHGKSARPGGRGAGGCNTGRGERI